MPRPFLYAFSLFCLAAALALPAAGQTVISARSGVIHFFSGSVSVNNQPLDPNPGKFQILALGDELRTAKGNAEVLLTPGVLLRMGQNSAMRMVSSELSDTQVELLAGSAILDSDEPVAHTSVTLIYKDWKVRFLQKGTYRMDTAPPKLWVDAGKAEVSGEANPAPATVEQGMDLPLAAELAPERAADEPADELSDWAEGRSESVSADNAIAAQISDDPAAAANMALDLDLGMDPGQDTGAGSLTYFPMLGLPAAGSDLPGLYNPLYPPQMGFSSIYLPGYTYEPPMLGLLINRYVGSPYLGTRIGIGTAPRVGISPLHNPFIGPMGSRPLPGVRPASPPVRGTMPHAAPLPHGAVGGIHR